MVHFYFTSLFPFYTPVFLSFEETVNDFNKKRMQWAIGELNYQLPGISFTSENLMETVMEMNIFVSWVAHT